MEKQINDYAVEVEVNQKRKEREMKLTQEQVLEMEILHNVYIDVGSMTFTHGKREDIYGWRPIPAEWYNR